MKLLGYVTNLQDYQHIADVCVSCSKREGLPLNVVEAMLSGTPVVVTNNRGHRELITDGVDGFVVVVGDENSMLQHIRSILNDASLCKTLTEKGLLKGNMYSVASVAKELEKVYADVFN